MSIQDDPIHRRCSHAHWLAGDGSVTVVRRVIHGAVAVYAVIRIDSLVAN